MKRHPNGLHQRPMRHALTAPTLIGAIALLSSCTQLAPRYERPAAPVDAKLPSPAQAGVTAETALPPWQSFIADPTAQALVKLALVHNRDLRVASLNLEKARAAVTIANADRLPTVNGVMSGSRAPNAFGQQTTQFQGGLSVTSYELDLWGRVRNAAGAAQASLLASDASRRSTELSVVAGVVSTYLSLVADEALVALAERTLRTRDETLRLTNLRVRVGASADPERLAAESLSAQARASLAQLQRQRQADESALAVLIGQPLPADLRSAIAASVSASTSASMSTSASTSRSDSAPASASPALDPSDAATPLLQERWLQALQPGTSSQVLLGRPDVIAAEQQLIAANANIGVARAALFPRIGLTGSAGAVSSDLGRLITDPTFAWSLVSQATVALFDSGRNRANIQVSELNRDVAVAQYEKTVQTAFKEAADAITGLDNWRQQLDALQLQRKSERERARLTTLRYEQGAASALDQLDSQSSLFTTEQAVIQTRLAELQNRLALYKALGGWPEASGTQAGNVSTGK